MTTQKAVIVLSGGQDSITCLFWAIAQGWDVRPITFLYGQRHAREVDSACMAVTIAEELIGKPIPHRVVQLPSEILRGASPLVNPNAVLEQYADHHSLPGGLEKTFVPMRNQLFLTIAANHAYVSECDTLVTGVCEEDFGGYPDCRREFIDLFETTSTLGTFSGDGADWHPQGLRVITPLMHLTKADTVRLAFGDRPRAMRLSVRGSVGLDMAAMRKCIEALAYSHTAYDGQYPPSGRDHATLLRAKGFEEAGYPDPLVVRACSQGRMGWPTSNNYERAALDKFYQEVGACVNWHRMPADGNNVS